MKEKKSYRLKHLIVAIVLSLVVAVAVTYLITQEICKSSYSEARQSGYNEGYEVGYDEGYSAAEDSYDNYDTGYLGPYTGGDDYGTSYEDGITEYSVFVTPSGEKYHTEYCRYIEGKSNLSYYDSASDAAAAGYEPCSVCNP